MKNLLIITILILLASWLRKPFSFTSPTSGGAQINKTAASSWTLSTSTGWTSGTIIVLAIATDNLSTTDGNSNTHTTITDDQGNTWTKLREYTNSQSSAAAGVTVSLWWTKLATTSWHPSINFSGSITAKAAAALAVTVGTGNQVSITGTPQDLQNDGVNAGSLTINGLTNTEHLFLRATGVEGTTVPTASANYSIITGTTSGGNAASNIGIGLEYRIFTSSSDATDPGGGALDHASIMLALNEISSFSRRVFTIQ